MDNPDFFLRITPFTNVDESQAAYRMGYRVIMNSDADLSIFRLQFDGRPYVVVLGKQPEADILQRLAYLAEGPRDALPIEVIRTLVQRREDAGSLGPWVEGHYPGGLHFTIPRDEEDPDAPQT